MMSWLVVAALVPFALVLLVACIRDPMRVALPLYAATIPFGEALSVGPTRFGSASSLLGVVLALGLMAQFVTGRAAARRLPPEVAVWLLFLSLASATMLWTINPSETISGTLVLASLVVTFALAALSEVDATAVHRTETGLILGGVLVVAYGLVQMYLLGGFSSEPDAVLEGTRFGDDMLGPNILAVTLLMSMALALHRTFDPPFRGRSALYGVTVLVLLVGVLMTGSRTGTVGAGLLVLAMLWASPRSARPGLLATFAGGSLLALVVWIYHPLGLAERSFESATSPSGRLDIWEVGFAACEDYCGWGSGWGTFPDVYVETLASVPAARILSGSDAGAYEAHNVVLLALVEVGVLGALILAVALLVSFVHAVRLPSSYRGQAVGMMVGLAVGLMFLSSIEFKIFWLVLLLVTMYNALPPPEGRRRRSLSRAEVERTGS